MRSIAFPFASSHHAPDRLSRTWQISLFADSTLPLPRGRPYAQLPRFDRARPAHFSANHSDDYGLHNQKWAILSVAHATEAFCNLLLLAIDPGDSNGPKYPDLGKAINRLKRGRSAKLSNSERRALKNIFPGLEKQRNELMHRLPPPKLDMEQTALALLVLLYLILTAAPRAAGGASQYLEV